MLFTCAHAYTRTTHVHACALYLDIQAKPKAFLRAHTRVLQGIYIRGRTYAHARAQISNNIYCIHYYDSRPISTRQHREPAAAYTCTFCHGLMSMQKLSYTSNVSAFFCMNKKKYLGAIPVPIYSPIFNSVLVSGHFCIYVIFRRKCVEFGYICKATFYYNKALYLFASL